MIVPLSGSPEGKPNCEWYMVKSQAPGIISFWPFVEIVEPSKEGISTPASAAKEPPARICLIKSPKASPSQKTPERVYSEERKVNLPAASGLSEVATR